MFKTLRRFFGSILPDFGSHPILSTVGALFTAGAILTVGFLSSSGMYVLAPVLSVTLLAFFLSNVYEGEVFYRNFLSVFNKLRNPHYFEEQLTKECLQECLESIHEKETLQKEIRLYLEDLSPTQQHDKFDAKAALKWYKHFLETVAQFEDWRHLLAKNNLLSLPKKFKKLSLEAQKEQIGKAKAALQERFSENIKSYKKYEENTEFQELVTSDAFPEKITSNNIQTILTAINNNPIYPTPFFQDLSMLLKIYHKYDEENLGGYDLGLKLPFGLGWGYGWGMLLSKRSLLLSEKGGEIHYSMKTSTGEKVIDEPTGIKAPEPFILKNLAPYKAQILKIAISKEHAHQDYRDEKKKVKEAIRTLEHCFMEQLFPDTNKSQQTQNEDTAAYTDGIKTFLATHDQTWATKLQSRRRAFFFGKVFSGLASVFMMLGTAYLLVEAFGAFTFMAAVPFGVWPAFIVPMAIIAGTAYGLLTYNALTDMINDDIFLKSFRKLKADWEKGHRLRPGLVLLGTLGLMSLAIALTVCTGGTWWTIMRKTRPLFAWMARIPVAIIGIGAGFLSAAALVFNVPNTFESVEEMSEAAGSLYDPDRKFSPYDLVLLLVDDNKTSLKVKYKHPTLIKKGNQYWMVGKLNGVGQPKATRLPDHIFDYLDFEQEHLRFSFFSLKALTTYLRIKYHQAHTFAVSREKTWIRWINPPRIILKLTYTPLRLVLFMGHLISIGVTADRLPGLSKIISAFFGILAEFFEDWHYFFSLEHTHKHDTPSLYEEYNEEDKGHDHADDLPTRILRTVFVPMISLAVLWDKAFSDKPLSFEDAWDRQTGLPEEAAVEIKDNTPEATYVSIINNMPEESVENKTEPHATAIPHPTTSINVNSPYLVDNLANKTNRFIMFKSTGCNNPGCDDPGCDDRSSNRTRQLKDQRLFDPASAPITISLQ